MSKLPQDLFKASAGLHFSVIRVRFQIVLGGKERKSRRISLVDSRGLSFLDKDLLLERTDHARVAGTALEGDDKDLAKV